MEMVVGSQFGEAQIAGRLLVRRGPGYLQAPGDNLSLGVPGWPWRSRLADTSLSFLFSSCFDSFLGFCTHWLTCLLGFPQLWPSVCMHALGPSTDLSLSVVSAGESGKQNRGSGL